ncbi:TPR-like protein, partial [Lizonia empirigonia]
YGKHKVELSLQGVPVVGQFVDRPAEMVAVEQILLEASPPISPTTKHRQKVVAVYGLGGIGKTQLAVEFARKHHHRFSAVFWLDGSSKASLEQSFVDVAQRLPRDELTADGAARLSEAAVEADVAVRECQRWLTMPSNRHWLLIIDNVDRDHYHYNDPQAYNVQTYFPHADHGSILITSRLPSLQRLGAGVKVGTVAAEQARAILENNAGRVVEDAEVVFELLHGLPLALTQAGSYMRETNASASTYAKHYSRTWERLMESEARFPREEYGDRSVLTTWTISYTQVQRESEKAAWLLKLWGFLDSGEVWYELIAAGSDLAAEMDVPAWLLAVAENELAYGDAMGLLSRYSLAEGREGTDSHSMHSVLHRWCRYLTKDEEEQHELGCLAVGLVASNVSSESEAEFWKKRKRVMAHVQMYQRALQGKEKAWGPEHTSTLHTVNNLGILYKNLGRLDEAENMFQRALQGYEKAWGPEHTSTLDTVNNLGILYKNLGRLDEAENMFQRALQGYEKAWGPEHTSTLDTVNNLGNLCVDLGRLDEAEKMYQRALQGYEKAWGPEHTSTLDTVNNLGILYKNLGRLDEAEQMYQRALQGFEKAWGPEHTSTLDTVNNLGNLCVDLGRLDEAEKMFQRALQGKEKAWGPEHTSTLDTVNNLAGLYMKLGRLDEAEKMYQRALAGYAKSVHPDNLLTCVPALNNMWAFASLRQSQGCIEDARHWYSHALLGYKKTFGERNDKCQALRDNLAALA